uniref:ATP-binding cassette domain-containing protein n=1 Tax=Aminobacter niigataensis TaxID=83265 RepID=UPI0028526756|nr:ATP-binding cassette domain-containing protein [Aminobacter niigataensis]WMD00232.1 ATP-binding cassette domain-containing protein [Aminobacter niigataensis]
MQDIVFDVTNVSRRYNAGRPSLFGSREFINAVDGVTLSVKRDEVLGIIGESGSGKSTLGFLMAGLESVSNGEIAFRGKPLAAMNRSERKAFRQKVQVVFQDSGSALNPRRRIINTLRDSLRLRGMPRELRDASAIKLLDQVGLSSVHAGRYPHELSGGQRQRVGIARALAMEPEVLIADEPVSALDVSLQGQIINLLLELKARFKLTIVFISHDIAVVNHACDRVAVMYRGRLVEVGATDDIIQNPGDSYTAQLLAAVPRGLAGRNCSLNSDALPTGEGE